MSTNKTTLALDALPSYNGTEWVTSYQLHYAFWNRWNEGDVLFDDAPISSSINLNVHLLAIHMADNLCN